MRDLDWVILYLKQDFALVVLIIELFPYELLWLSWCPASATSHPGSLQNHAVGAECVVVIRLLGI